MVPRSFLPVVLIAALAAGCTSASGGPATPSSPGAPPASAAPAVDYTAWAAGRSEPVADKLYPARGNPGLDVLHYGLNLAWEPTTRMLTGEATLRIRPVTAAGELSLDFTGLTLDGVTLDGAPAAGTVTKEKLRVTAPVTADRPVTLVVRYHGTPKQLPMPSRRGDAADGLGMRVAKDGSLWTMQEPWGALTWYPANEHPSDEALYDIAVTVPAGWSAVASGTPGAAGDGTFRYTSADPVATYLVTMAAGKYRRTTAQGPRGLPITYWTRPRTDDNLLKVLKKSPEQLAWLERKFGPYPFPTAGVVVVDSASGMETQQMVTLGGRRDKWSVEVAGDFESIMLHEYAHQWFGNAVTPRTWTDLWLNEGWAEYTQYLWEQEKFDVPRERLTSFLRETDAKLRKRHGPPGKPKAGQFAEGVVYIAPAAMLHTLHQQLGDKRFFALGRDWVQKQRNTTQDRASFIAFVNQHTGKDFTELINTWLDSPTTPR